ncbi:MAG: thiamine phosphate synthase [Archaeoglobales archaeon]|nr:thiamine phosphate synthase [Archaeoglobales archaeon]
MFEKLKIYFITDSRFGKHEELAEKVLKAGVRAIQLREKSMSSKEIYEVAKKIRKLTLDYDALFIVNDRLDIALASDADGVHLGQEDLPFDAARDIFGGILGVSVHSVEEAMKAERYADYLGVGPVFATKSKEDAKEPLGIEKFKNIVSSTKVPVIAIGGINHSNVKEVLRAGAFGVAVISAIAMHADVYLAARSFLDIIQNA